MRVYALHPAFHMNVEREIDSHLRSGHNDDASKAFDPVFTTFAISPLYAWTAETAVN